MPSSFVTAAGLDDNNTFTGANTFTGTVTFTGATVDEGSQAIAPAVSASGTPTVPLTVTAAADLAITTTVESPSVYLNLSATRTWATGAITSQRAFKVAAPTYAFAGASTITNAATFYIDAAPTAGTNATITNSYALWVDDGASRFDGAVIAGTVGPTAAQQHTLPAIASGTVALLEAAQSVSGVQTFTAAPIVAPTASASGTPAAALAVTAGADLLITAGTEAPSVHLNLSATRQWATGALAAQRGVVITAPTYGFVGASVVTHAATVNIEGAPIAGANATFTNAYALLVTDGLVKFGGALLLGSTLTVGSNVLVGTVADKLNPVHLAHATQATGDLLVADSATTMAPLPDVAVGQVLKSGGVGAAPAYGAIGGTTAAAAPTATAEAFAGTGFATAGQVVTTTDNQTMTLNECAGMWLITATQAPCLIVSNTAVTGAPAVLTVYGLAPTTDAGTYKILRGASHTHGGTGLT